MFNLLVQIFTPVGIFVGVTNNSALAKKVAEETRDTLEKNLDKMNYLVIYNTDGDETAFSGTMLKSSVVKFTISPA